MTKQNVKDLLTMCIPLLLMMIASTIEKML